MRKKVNHYLSTYPPFILISLIELITLFLTYFINSMFITHKVKNFNGIFCKKQMKKWFKLLFYLFLIYLDNRKTHINKVIVLLPNLFIKFFVLFMNVLLNSFLLFFYLCEQLDEKVI